MRVQDLQRAKYLQQEIRKWASQCASYSGPKEQAIIVEAVNFIDASMTGIVRGMRESSEKSSWKSKKPTKTEKELKKERQCSEIKQAKKLHDSGMTYAVLSQVFGVSSSVLARTIRKHEQRGCCIGEGDSSEQD